MATTNYVDTFIHVAEDCPATTGTAPPSGAWPTVAQLQYELLVDRPHQLTSDDVIFAVHAIRHGIPEAEQPQAREDFFARSQACLRSSPLAKRYGWGLHHDAEARVALVAIDSPQYAHLAADETLHQTRAMRSRRA